MNFIDIEIGFGESSMAIIIDEKKNYKNEDEFLKMVSNKLELDEPIRFLSDESKEISEDEFINYWIWQMLDRNKENVTFEFSRYNKFFVVFDNIPKDGVALLAESDGIYSCVYFFDAG